MTDQNLYLGLLFANAACTFEGVFPTQEQRAEALIQTLQSNHDEVEPDELDAVLSEHADSEPDERLTAVHALYMLHAGVDMHLAELEAPAQPSQLFTVVTDYGDSVAVEAFPSPTARLASLIKRTSSLTGKSFAITDEDALANILAQTLGEGVQVHLATSELDHGGWMPSLVANHSSPAIHALPERLWVVHTDYGNDHSIEVNPSEAEHRTGLIERLRGLGAEVDPANTSTDALAEDLAMRLARDAAATLTIEVVELVKGSWTREEQ